MFKNIIVLAANFRKRWKISRRYIITNANKIEEMTIQMYAAFWTFAQFGKWNQSTSASNPLGQLQVKLEVEQVPLLKHRFILHTVHSKSQLLMLRRFAQARRIEVWYIQQNAWNGYVQLRKQRRLTPFRRFKTKKNKTWLQSLFGIISTSFLFKFKNKWTFACFK